MNKKEAFVGQRVVVNTNIGAAHKQRLVPGMVGTIEAILAETAGVTFDQPFMKIFDGSWRTCNVLLERLDPAPEDAVDASPPDA